MKISATVASGVANFKRHHGLLIVGGSEKARSALADDITAALYCKQQQGSACGSCKGCKGFQAMRPLYVQDIVPDGPHIYIEQIKKEWDVSGLTSVALIRVLRVMSVERITWEAAVMLLKRLEEPPASLKIILTASRAAFVLPTIRSRVATLTLPGGEDTPKGERFHSFVEASEFVKEHSDDRALLVRKLTATLHHAHDAVTALAKKTDTPPATLAAGKACLAALATSIHDLEYTTVVPKLTIDHAAAACAFLMKGE